MMPKDKAPTEHAEKATRVQGADNIGGSGAHDRPQQVEFSKEEVHAASLLHAPHGDGSAPERARKMAALQHRMGNARLGRLLGEAGVPEAGGVKAEEIPKRE